MSALRGCKGQYTESWLCRTFLFTLMRSSGITQLDPQGIGIRVLSRMVPDQRQWLWRLTGVGGVQRMSLKDLLKRVGYSGPIELFSMWACICTGIAAGKVLGRTAELRHKCIEFQQLHGWPPHPAMLAEL